MKINDSGSGVGGIGGGGEETTTSSITPASPIVAAGSAIDKETTTNNKKPQLCRFYFQNDKCSYGSSCRFSHDKPNDNMTREEILQTIPCPHYTRGYCAFGDQCELLHHSCSTTPLQEQLQKHERQEQQKLPQQQNHYQQKQQENNDDNTLFVDTTCGICLENVYNTKQCKFGLLSCCDHVFCFSCLMQWRTRNSNSSSQGNNNNRNNRNNNNNNSEISSSTRRVCPTCRKSSNYVVPSTTFPTNSTEKTNIVTNYKNKCSHIKCKKYTVGKLNSCPFGRDCFYAHYNENGIDMKKEDMTMQELFEERERHRVRRNRNRNRESDLDMIAEMLMMMALQREFGGGRDGGGSGGRRGGGGRRGERRSRGGQVTDDDHDEDEDDDEFGIDDFLLHMLSMAGDNDMPFPLQHLFGAMAASAFNGEEDDGSSPLNRIDEEDDDSLDSMPPLEEIAERHSDLAIALEEIGAEFEEEENNSDDDNSMPALEDLDNDDDNSMPPLEDIE